jgi:hypothetical protein
MATKRICITGQRTFGDGGQQAWDLIRSILFSLPLDVELVIPVMQGAGAMAARVAKDEGFAVREIRAEEKGPQAAFAAVKAALAADFNEVMVFGDDSDSKAAQQLIRQAHRKGRDVRYVQPTGKLRTVKGARR